MPREKQFEEEEVLQKAMLLFWKKGYHDTSLKALIAALGISNASIYNTFGGKRQLFDRAFARYRTANFLGMQQFLHSQKNVREGLRAVFQKIIRDDHADSDGKGCFVVNSTTELIPADPDFRFLLTDHQQNTEQVFVDFLRMGVEMGQIPAEKNLPVIANLLYTVMTGLRVIGKTRPDPKESMLAVEVVLLLLD